MTVCPTTTTTFAICLAGSTGCFLFGSDVIRCSAAFLC